MPDYSTVPFAEAIAYLAQKVSIPSPGTALDAEHDSAFVVAGAKGSLLADIRSITKRGITEGWTLDKFKAKFNVVADGWSGNKDWRAQIIYQTNLRMAYAAGRYSYQLAPDTIKAFPYLEFVHSDHTNFRPLHKALDGKVFRADKIPLAVPNGFGCGCRWISLDEEMLGDRTISTLERGDEIEGIPVEPEPGFDYTPGQSSAKTRKDMIDNIIKRLPPKEANWVREEIKRVDATFAIASEVVEATPKQLPPILEGLTVEELQDLIKVLEGILLKTDAIQAQIDEIRKLI